MLCAYFLALFRDLHFCVSSIYCSALVTNCDRHLFLCTRQRHSFKVRVTKVIVIPRKTMCVTATPLSAKKILKNSARHPARTSIATNVQVQGLTGGTNNVGETDRPQHTSIMYVNIYFLTFLF